MIENGPAKVLVIRFSSMGDVILVTSLFSALKRRFPDCDITFLTDSQYTELFSDDPRLFSVLGVSRKQNVWGSELLEEKWDLVVDLQKNRRSQGLVSLLKHKNQVGMISKHHCKRVMLLLARMGKYSESDRVGVKYLNAAGINDSNIEPDSCKLFFKSTLPNHVELMIHTGEIIRPLIALIPFAAWKNKAWPEEYFVNVGRFFLVKGWDVCILGGPAERKKADALAELIGQRCFSLAGRLSLYDCGCFLKKCSLALGNDTGLSHLARACGVKTGVIYGPTTRHWGFFPWGEPPFKIFESSFFCRPCHAHGGNICLLNKACLRKIRSGLVIKGLMELVEAEE